MKELNAFSNQVAMNDFTQISLYISRKPSLAEHCYIHQRKGKHTGKRVKLIIISTYKRDHNTNYFKALPLTPL